MIGEEVQDSSTFDAEAENDCPGHKLDPSIPSSHCRKDHSEFYPKT